MSDRTEAGTAPDLAALRELSDAATPGPWALDTSPGFQHHIRTGGTSNAVPTIGEPIADAALDEDAALIVAAVNYVRAALAPYVTAQVEQRDAEIARLRTALQTALAQRDARFNRALNAERELAAALARVDTARRDALTEAADALATAVPGYVTVEETGDTFWDEFIRNHYVRWLRARTAVESPDRQDAGDDTERPEVRP